MKKEIEKLWDDYRIDIWDLGIGMKDKADKWELKELELYFLNRMGDMIHGFEKQFANREQTIEGLGLVDNKV